MLTRVAHLVRNTAQLDPDEDNIQQFLTSNFINYTTADAAMINNFNNSVGVYNVLYMRTGAEPTTYNDPDVISKITTRIETGAKLVFEYYGLYLGAYLGVGTIYTHSWGPVVTDACYFVEAISANSIFYRLNITNWSPPLQPDDNNHLIVKLSQTGGYTYPVFNFNSTSQSIEYWLLYTTYGWSGLGTDSEYCLQSPGICTSERSVYNSLNDGIEFINFGQGSIYRLGLRLGQGAPASSLIFGPVANQLRKNVIREGIALRDPDLGNGVNNITENNLGTQPNSPIAAEPVNTAIGNYTYEHSDLRIPGKGMPFEFKRGYNSLDPYNGPLGYGWTHSYNIVVNEYTDAVTVKWGDGHQDVYNKQGDGSLVPALPGIYDTLVKNP